VAAFFLDRRVSLSSGWLSPFLQNNDFEHSFLYFSTCDNLPILSSFVQLHFRFYVLRGFVGKFSRATSRGKERSSQEVTLMRLGKWVGVISLIVGGWWGAGKALATGDNESGKSGSPTGEEVQLTEEEQQLLELTNAERQRCGLRPLRPHPLLMLAARRHAQNMARQGCLSHTLDGKTFADRVSEVGYVYRHLSENIAWNPATPLAALRCWLASPGHRANLLGPCEEVGLAVATNGWGERYWVQIFGSSGPR
jgi:hypothetical protein